MDRIISFEICFSNEALYLRHSHLFCVCVSNFLDLEFYIIYYVQNTIYFAFFLKILIYLRSSSLFQWMNLSLERWHHVTPVHNFRQHHHDIAQMVDQAFLRLDLHPKDGLLEMNELTTVFTTRDTDGSWFNINSTNQITIDFHFINPVYSYCNISEQCYTFIQMF